MRRLIVFDEIQLDVAHPFLSCMGGLEVRLPVLMLIVTEGRLLSSICLKKRCKLVKVFTAVKYPGEQRQNSRNSHDRNHYRESKSSNRVNVHIILRVNQGPTCGDWFPT